MTHRLNKVLKDFNIGINVVAEFLYREGHPLNDASPNAKITEEQYQLIADNFDKRLYDKDLEEATTISKKQELEETPFVENTITVKNAESVVDKISVVYEKIEEVIARLKELAEGDEEVSRQERDYLKASFYKIHKQNTEAEYAKFLEEGGSPDDFKPTVDNDEVVLKELLAAINAKRAKSAEAEKEEREANYAKKLAIIEKIRAILEKPEEVNRAYSEFKALQQEWNEIKNVPQDKASELWKTYQHYVEIYYDTLKVTNELRAYDFKKNLELKTALCERAEALADIEDIIAAAKQLQLLHQEFREIGPVDKNQSKNIWNRFKAASDVVNKRYQNYIKLRKTKESENLARKTAICEKIEAINTDELKTIEQWNMKSDEIIALQQEWKTIGPVSQKMTVKIFGRFQGACDHFFNQKSEFDKHNTSSKTMKTSSDIDSELYYNDKNEDNDDSRNSTIPLRQIPIGQMVVNWKYAIGNYKLSIIQTWPLTTFDKVICKLLSALNFRCSISQIGEILGFNVVDNPAMLQYKDEAECKILYDEIKRLSNFGLIEFDNDEIFLTEEGVKANETGLRNEEKTENVKLYFDSFGNDAEASELFELEPGTEIEEDFTNLIGEESHVYELFRIQHSEYQNRSSNTSIKSLQKDKIIQKHINVTFEILYEFTTNEFHLNCISDKAEIFNRIVNRDDELKNLIISNFIQQQKESVIHKPVLQEKFEEWIKASNEFESFIDNIIIGTEKGLFNYIEKEIKDYPPLISFYFEELTEDMNTIIMNFSKKVPYSFICIEFSKGDDRFNNYGFRNISYKKVNELSCKSICVFSNHCFFEEELCVIKYKEQDYQIPLIVLKFERKYIIPKLTNLFMSDIDQIVSLCNAIFNNNFKANIDANFTKLYRTYDLAKSLQFIYKETIVGTKQEEHIEQLDCDFHKLTEKMIERLEKNNHVTRDILNYYDHICKKYATDYLPRIEKMNDRLITDDPSSIKPNAWIIDANVFIDSPDILDKFTPNKDVVCVLRSIKGQIDKKAHKQSAAGERAKRVRTIINDKIENQENLVQIKELTNQDLFNLPNGMDKNEPDNHIIALAKKLEDRTDFSSITIITSDKNLISDAKSLNLRTCTLESFLSDLES